jgi:NitT/TauT family transport system ATP-binding protein
MSVVSIDSRHRLRNAARDMYLSARNLSLVYETSQGPLAALGPLDLDVSDGEFVAILGPSGCGKSTLLKIFSGLLQPTTGLAELAGTSVDAPRRDVGIVFQQPTLLPWKTVKENILMPVRVLGTYATQHEFKARELMDMVGLSNFGEHYPHELSGGMQQRVGIARALIHEPRLLLMDEPFAALDALTREQITFDLQDIWENSKKAVVLITHSIPEAVLMADRVLVLSPRPGRIVHAETVNLPRPRGLDSMKSPEFAEATDRLRRILTSRAPHPEVR